MARMNFTDMKFPCLCPLVLLLKAWWRQGGSVENDSGLLEYAAGETSRVLRSIFNSFPSHQCKYAHDMCGYLSSMFTV
jgi:hypothetical protein